MENTSAIWPISVETTSLQESVTFLEEEVVVDKLLPLVISH